MHPVRALSFPKFEKQVFASGRKGQAEGASIQHPNLEGNRIGKIHRQSSTLGLMPAATCRRTFSSYSFESSAPNNPGGATSSLIMIGLFNSSGQVGDFFLT